MTQKEIKYMAQKYTFPYWGLFCQEACVWEAFVLDLVL